MIHEIPAKGAIEMLPENERISKATQTTSPLPDDLVRGRGFFHQWNPMSAMTSQKMVLTSLPKMTRNGIRNDYVTEDIINSSSSFNTEIPTESVKLDGLTSFAVEKYRLNNDHVTTGCLTLPVAASSQTLPDNSVADRQVAAKPSQLPLGIDGNPEKFPPKQRTFKALQADRKWNLQKPEVHLTVRAIPRMGTKVWLKRQGHPGSDTAGISGKVESLERSNGNEQETEATDASASSAYVTGDSSCGTPSGTSDGSDLANGCEIFREIPPEKCAGTAQNRGFDESIFELDEIGTKSDENLPEIGQENRKTKREKSNENRSNDFDSQISKANTHGRFSESRSVVVKASDFFIGGERNQISSNQKCFLCHVTGLSSANDVDRSAQVTCVDVMYTNRANLEHTIMVQQSLYEQHLCRSCHERQNAPGQSHRVQKDQFQSDRKAGGSKNEVGIFKGEASQVGLQGEWVVKRRSDGSRYITKRPVTGSQSKKQKNRSRRNAGHTSSDDDVSSDDVKLGRQCSREERRKHVETSRQRHKNKEEISRQRIALTRDGAFERKMADGCRWNAFDQVTTMHEILLSLNEDEQYATNNKQHGNTNNNNNNNNNHNALFFVTTI